VKRIRESDREKEGEGRKREKGEGGRREKEGEGRRREKGEEPTVSVIATLSEDRMYIKARTQRHESRSLMSSLATSACNLGYSFADGVLGVAIEPWQGFNKEGFEGLSPSLLLSPYSSLLVSLFSFFLPPPSSSSLFPFLCR
jgi:hypothetical protein